MGDSPRYSFVLPVYNEEETLPQLVARLTAVLDALDGESEVIFVDDGSTDSTHVLLSDLVARDPRMKTIRLTRNFGHQLAITAGLDHAAGDAVIVMDADLQDPPELVPELVQRWREGYEVVYAVRGDRNDPLARRFVIRAFYRVLRRLTNVEIPVDAGDFRLVDRRALDAFSSMRENNRYVRGMFSWIGFRQIGVPYHRGDRYAGRSKYPLPKLVKLGADALISFSHAPLRLALALGFLVSFSAFLLGIVAVALRLAGLVHVPGWASTIVVVSLLGGAQLMVMGMMGLYVARIYEEVKGRPLYLVRDAQGLVPTDAARPLVGRAVGVGSRPRPR